jgi:rod shape determining protein RodA
MDWWMLIAVGLLMVIGVLFIYSAKFQAYGLPVEPLYQRQIVWCMIGMVVFVATTVLDYRWLGRHAGWIYLLGLGLLVLVLVVGTEVYGGRRWLLIGGLRLQPSELAKLTTLLLLAWHLSRPTRDPAEPQTVIQVGLLSGLPFALVFVEPDLGTAAVLIPLALVMLYAAGAPLKTLLFLCVVGLLLLPVGWQILDSYQKERVLVFLDPSRDPTDAGWSRLQTAIAVGSGGLTGKGFLAGTQNVLGFLPSSVAHNDFIYSVVAEEMGFTGSTLVLALYAAVLLGALRAALLAVDKFGRLVAVGVATLLFSHVFVNIAMTIGLLPITGLPLPLMSYGGSFMVVTMCGLGLVQSVYVRRVRQ